MSVCVFCGLEVYDDGVVLVGSTGGDTCGVPLDDGSEHLHCRTFAPDVDGDDPDVCIECLCHKIDHPVDNARVEA